MLGSGSVSEYPSYHAQSAISPILLTRPCNAQSKIAASQKDHIKACDWRMIRLGGVADVPATSKSTPIPGQEVSSLSRARHQRVEPGDNLLSALAKTTYSPGQCAWSSWILASAVCKSRTASTHSKFTTSIFLRMSKRISMVARICNKSGQIKWGKTRYFYRIL
jgi:hypothetical protein